MATDRMPLLLLYAIVTVLQVNPPPSLPQNAVRKYNGTLRIHHSAHIHPRGYCQKCW